MRYHGLALIIGYVLDLIVGDPHEMPHPIRLIGKWISFVEKKIYKDKKTSGLYLVFAVTIPVVFITAFITICSYCLSNTLGMLVESVFVFYCLATRSLAVESGEVIRSLYKDGIEASRKSLSMIVGRDTEKLTEEQVIKATVETVAENTSDGVVAPLLYLAIGGATLGLFYKACNTMDSMVGYKNDRYKNFGFYAAKLDDILNYIPSRICALLIIISAFLLTNFDGKNAYKIWNRDKRNHKSPNSAQSESAYAGAMGLKLAGGAFYFGSWVEKPFIGDPVNNINRLDVYRSHKLLYMTSLLCEVICTAVIFIVAK
ncbi:MAG: adenosylcobinamide-phosphate synthase CbiB [Lachnospiraceae bacterium]|nr:adenosylcobinamide-phosphate synthase CbiB [Lachnospiraceae bacterium]